MRKVSIIGNAGGGKSVLARQLGSGLNIPVYVVDDAQWEPAWQPALPDKVAMLHNRWLTQRRWIIDGWGGWDLIEQRLLAADTIIVVDFPLWVHYWWALRRHIAAIMGRNQGWPPAGCRAWPVTFKLLRVMWHVNRELRPRLLNLVAEARFQGRIVYIQSPQQLHAFRQRALTAEGL